MKKADQQTDRNELYSFEQIINIGPKIADQFREIGLKKPQDLKKKDPLDLYQRIISARGVFIDPCVLDTYMAAVEFMNGNPPKVWWAYTEERKEKYSEDVEKLRAQY